MADGDPAFAVSIVDLQWRADLLSLEAVTALSGGDRRQRCRELMETARHEMLDRGLRASQLRRCEEEGPEGTRLPNCVKLYVAEEPEQLGVVFTFELREGRLGLLALAMGLRHPRLGQGDSIYVKAHRRLQAKPIR